MPKTGFSNGFADVPTKKYYKYHGWVRDCHTEPVLPPYLEYPIGPPYGPEQEMIVPTIDARLIYLKTYNYVWGWNWIGGSPSYNIIGQGKTISNLYIIYRYFMVYNTAILPINCKIISATIKPYVGSYRRPDLWKMRLQWGGGVHPSYPINGDDYNRAFYSGNYGESTYWAIGHIPIELTGAGIGLINKLGYTRFALRSTKEIAGDPPTGFEDASITNTHQSLFMWVKYKMPL